MDKNTNNELHSLVVVNREARVKTVELAQRLYSIKKHLCEHELPILTNYTNSIESLPKEIQNTVEELNKKICTNDDFKTYNKDLIIYIPKDEQAFIEKIFGKSMLQDIAKSIYSPVENTAIATGEAVGNITGKFKNNNLLQKIQDYTNIFRVISQRKLFNKQEEKVKETKKSTNVFQSAIEKIEFLLSSAEEQANDISQGVTIITDGPKNYEMMSKKQKKELIEVVKRLQKLSDELSAGIAA